MQNESFERMVERYREELMRYRHSDAAAQTAAAPKTAAAEAVAAAAPVAAVTPAPVQAEAADEADEPSPAEISARETQEYSIPYPDADYISSLSLPDPGFDPRKSFSPRPDAAQAAGTEADAAAGSSAADNVQPTPAPATGNRQISAPETAEGYLQVRVYTARGAIPLAGAKVTISGTGDNGESLKFSAVTDKSGLTPLFTLKTVSKELSEQPQDIATPYVSYNIRTVLDGYVPVLNENVPVFAGETAIQNIELLPKQENSSGGEEIIQESEPDL